MGAPPPKQRLFEAPTCRAAGRQGGPVCPTLGPLKGRSPIGWATTWTVRMEVNMKRLGSERWEFPCTDDLVRGRVCARAR
eukprot:13531928-Alexandrium_andersonii.AAC.1